MTFEPLGRNQELERVYLCVLWKMDVGEEKEFRGTGAPHEVVTKLEHHISHDEFRFHGGTAVYTRFEAARRLAEYVRIERTTNETCNTV